MRRDATSQTTMRTVAVALLLAGLIGAAAAGVDRERRAAEAAQAEQSAAVLAEAMMLQRLAEAAERANRSRRAAIEDALGRAAAEAEAAAARVSLAEEAAARRSNPAPSGPSLPIPGSCGDYTGNRAIGCALLLEWGYSLDQMPCLDSLWSKESGWNHLAHNASSGAYGIPQALPGDKMSAFGDDWQTNPATQIKWGLNYIDNRYGSPCGAWNFFLANNWY